ncbi:MAG: hypothetical protein ACK4E7_05280 [Permianibacter sp.]
MNAAKEKVSTERASHPWSRVPAAPSMARRSAGKYATGIFPIPASPFRGELIPQDPNDEPAAEMLKRLQSQESIPRKKSNARRNKELVP